MDDCFVNLGEEVILTFMTIWCFWISDSDSARETRSHHNRSLCANIYEHHYCVCQATLFLFLAWTDGKTKDIVVFTLILKAKARDYGKGLLYVTLVVFGQSQCTGPVGQSEQTALVGRRGFVEN